MEKGVYDNSNIAESYSGVTTPLTSSFIQHIYQEAYKHFCALMGVDALTIQRHNQMFSRMVVTIGCTIYYNLSNWHTMISWFPGYSWSAHFMDRMMGVQSAYRRPADTRRSSPLKRSYDIWRTVFRALAVAITFLRMGPIIRRFNRYFDRKIRSYEAIELSGLSFKELQGIYDAAYADLLKKWRGPIANDFAVMVSTGLSDMLFRRWCAGDNVFQFLHLPVDAKISALDPGQDLAKLRAEIANDQRLVELFRSSLTNRELYEELLHSHTDSSVTEGIVKYLNKFGARFPDELKLESTPLADRPEWIIALLRGGMIAASDDARAPSLQIDTILLEIPFVRRHILLKLLSWSNRSIQRREETRFRRTLLFTFVRRLFLAFGKLAVAQGLLRDEKDIFYCTLEEVFVLGTRGADTERLSDLISKRKENFVRWKTISMPVRIESGEDIEAIERNILLLGQVSPEKITDLRGVVASRPPNVDSIEGIALTLESFDENADYRGKILVTKHTDPGWTIVFPLLKGIIVERGGQLSHAAVVAREYNIPCIVGALTATVSIPTNTVIRMDLVTGALSRP